MGEKKSFALRIDAETMKAIEKWASDEFRSVNGQIEWMLSKSLRDAGRLKSKPGSAENINDTIAE
ncbi:MAG: DNA-binding protein [Bacteroidales bacterium]